jgi:tRNA(Ile)-lysidine synthase
VKNGAFSIEWVQRRVAALVPDYPDVALCVALSGGVDSVVLLAALAEPWRGKLRKQMRLRAVHVHHGLHANAGKWSAHCAELAGRLDVPLTTLRVKVARVRGASLEAAAREARYEAIAGVLAPDEVLLTAHHEDDQLETVLLQLFRGAGIAGLAAMPEVATFARGLLARPLLTRTRAELETWARSRSLTWVDDDTNENEQLDRNYLRRRVLPLIRERWPAASRSVARSARHVAEAKRLLDALALADVERAANGAALSVARLRALPADRRRNAVRFWIARAGHTLPDSTRLDEITRTVLDARPDANPFVEWDTTRLRRHAGQLTLESSASGADEPAIHLNTLRRINTLRLKAAESATTEVSEGTRWNWRAYARIRLPGSSGTLEITPDAHGPINLDTLPPELTIRQRKGGERLKSTRTGRTRTLKSLLQESHTPLADRAVLPLIFINDHLIAVADRWADHSIQATRDTRHRARIRWLRT